MYLSFLYRLSHSLTFVLIVILEAYAFLRGIVVSSIQCHTSIIDYARDRKRRIRYIALGLDGNCSPRLGQNTPVKAVDQAERNPDSTSQVTAIAVVRMGVYFF